MICKNCGTECQDNVMYCENCGANMQQENQYQQNEPYTMPDYGNYNGNSNYNNYNNMYNNPMQENKPVSMGTYLGWMLLGTVLGPISVVITIIFACMTENKNRANFFRAMLVIWAITFVISIVVFAILAVVGFSMLELTDTTIMDSYGNSYLYNELLRITSFIKF